MIDNDIGMCDDCGDERAPLAPLNVDITVSSRPVRTRAWLCAPCRQIRKSA